MAGRKYAIVTVTFEGEFDLLVLQARSMRIFCPADLVSVILVIDNSARPMSAGRKTVVLDEFGHLAGLVRFIGVGEIAVMPKGGGWLSQQILKLMIADFVDTERYLVLDSKNHLVAPLTPEFLEDPDGRARLVAHSFEKHTLRPHLERVLSYLHMDAPLHLGLFPYSVTPFIMYTAVSRELVATLSKREGMSFPELFEKHQLWEFLLYSAYLINSGRPIDQFYAFNQRSCPIIWVHTAHRPGCERAIKRSNEFALPFFAIHRRALMRLDRECRSMIAGFWAERGLFASPGAAEEFIERVRWRNRFLWLQSSPGKASRLARRTFRRMLERGVSPS